MKYIKKFDELNMDDVALVGGKNASLGQMITHLQGKDIPIPMGYAVTSPAYWHYVEFNNLKPRMLEIMGSLKDHRNLDQLEMVGSAMRALFEQGTMPEDLSKEIVQAYKDLSALYDQSECDVAVRSSATAEDLPTASFAGQQESYLNIHGAAQLLTSYKQCIASLFTNRAISYRVEQGFDHFKVALSVGVQKMIRSDLACSGVAFSLDTDTGFKDLIMINASWGLGESIVKGLVVPDEYGVFKPLLEKNYKAIIKKQLGKKQTKMVYTDCKDEPPVKTIACSPFEMDHFCLSDDQIIQLARMILTIEKHYTNLKGGWCPMDIEWAQDGIDKKLYIIQARPETIHSQENYSTLITYSLDKSPESAPKILVSGQSIGQRIISGKARIIESAVDINQIQEGEILVTQMTDPDWVPAMKKAAGIVTDKGGRTCHAAIVSRELKIPAIIGTIDATASIKTGQQITLDCSQGSTGYVYEGIISFATQRIELKTVPKLATKIFVNIADPDTAITTSMLPVDGVGLARLEFIVSNRVKVHPMALIYPEMVLDKGVQKKIDEITAAYKDKKQFFIDTVAYGVGLIAASFYPRPVIVRLSDFKTNEYRNLIGGIYFEPHEENPMLGWRGASRYYNEKYRDAFAMECAALKKVREEMGLDNVKIMIPFVRTPEEGSKVIDTLYANGLPRNNNGLQVIMMCEIPSNVLLIDQFSKIFDGFSIGSNDLTQLTLGVDRDSQLLAALFDERNAAVQKILAMAIEGAHESHRPIGICGQAPSDYPEIAEHLIQLGIDSISLNADSVIPFLMRHVDS